MNEVREIIVLVRENNHPLRIQALIQIIDPLERGINEVVIILFKHLMIKIREMFVSARENTHPLRIRALIKIIDPFEHAKIE